jgi:cysteinyl-tRNA synthetase
MSPFLVLNIKTNHELTNFETIEESAMNRKNFLLISIILSLISCKKSETEPFNHRQEMRDFVQEISYYARTFDKDFIVIPQNAVELTLNNPQIPGDYNQPYLDAIDGNGQEELYYGYFSDDVQTPASVTDYLNPLLVQAVNKGKTVMVTDYCYSLEKIGNSYNFNNAQHYISFGADSRQLDGIPFFPKQPFKINNTNITKLSGAKNFLYLINTNLFTNKEEFLDSLSETNFDILLIDLFFKDGTAFTSSEINFLKNKANGGKRLLICYLAIGEAEDYRYYWKETWESSPPEWLGDENPYWPGNYLVSFWFPEWQDIIYGDDDSYTKRIIDAGFDGLYLDLVDAYEYFESK